MPANPAEITPPWLDNPHGWGSIQLLSQLLGRPYFTILRWLRNGQLASFGIRSYRDHNRRWWIEIPPELREHDIR